MIYYEFQYLDSNGDLRYFVHPSYSAVKRRMKWLISRHCRYVGFYKCAPCGFSVRKIEVC